MDNNPVDLVPVSGIIATYNRSRIIKNTIESIALQNVQPVELIIIDSSDDNFTKEICGLPYATLKSTIKYIALNTRGAAIQRIHGIKHAKQLFILFLDDDIVLYQDCLKKLWLAINTSNKIGGVNAMIVNQHYTSPGLITRQMLKLLSNRTFDTYAGKCIGPAWNLLPADNSQLPSIVKVEWLNTTCTLYRRDALPFPVFDPHFIGYSLMEDLALSLKVGKSWALYNVREARIFHDSQPGSHKNRIFELSRMEIVNRYYIMTNILNSQKFIDVIKFILFQIFQILSTLNSKLGWRNLHLMLAGKVYGSWQIILKKY